MHTALAGTYILTSITRGNYNVFLLNWERGTFILQQSTTGRNKTYFLQRSRSMHVQHIAVVKVLEVRIKRDKGGGVRVVSTP